MKLIKKHIVPFSCTVLALIVVCLSLPSLLKKDEPPSISNTVIFEKIRSVSDLSTLQTLYSGVARVTNPQDFHEVLYYIAYEADIYAGIDFNDITVSLDEDSKTLTVTLPESRITSFEVDINSLDYIFLNTKYNISGVSGDAYQECYNDIAAKSLDLVAVRELAHDNAQNVIRAMTLPFLDEIGKEYRLVIQ